MGCEVDILDAGIRKTQLCDSKTIAQTPVGADGRLTIEQQPEPFIAAEIIGALVNR